MGSNSEGTGQTQDRAVSYRIRWGNAGLAVAGVVALAAALALPFDGEDASPRELQGDIWSEHAVTDATPAATGPTTSVTAERAPRAKPARRRRAQRSSRPRRHRDERRPNRPSQQPGTAPPNRPISPPSREGIDAVEREFGL